MNNYNNVQKSGPDRFVKEPIVISSVLLLISWTLLTGYSLYWNITNLYQRQVDLAASEARANWNKDRAFRDWTTRQGGVYVKTSDQVRPNENLAHLKNRDLHTLEGVQLTLLNPAFILREMTAEFEQATGIKGRLTAKQVFNLENKADAWEQAAIARFEQGIEEVIEETEIDGAPYLRFMKPVYVNKECIHCHGDLGFKEGDLRGGMSVSVPLTPYLTSAAQTVNSMVLTHASVWLLGFLGIVAFAWMARVREKDRFVLQAQLAHDALHDVLTDLPNRTLFTDRLNTAIRMKQRDPGYQFAICFLDLDRFKNLNDSYGHKLGDEMLKQVAERFSEITRPMDTVARMGGDEFTFLLENYANDKEAVSIIERLLATLKEPFDIAGTLIYTNASIGVCFGDSNYKRADDMIRDADIAMYQAKSSGKGQAYIFDPHMHRQAVVAMQIENDLRHALINEQFEVYYQPIINLQENRIDGFEALLRWHHPQLGDVPPDDFIPVAEDMGVIGEIGEWVLRQACAQVQQWSDQYRPEEGFFVSVNLSGRQIIDSGLKQTIAAILESTGMDPARLHCEITETMLIQHKELAAVVMDDIQAMGVHISIDDFGKGYCSLTYLHRFKFNTLKIDKSFVQDMSNYGKGLSLVRTIMVLARDFGTAVVAEGVEDKDQLDRLLSLKCRWAQGYYFYKPSPADALSHCLQAGCHQLLGKLGCCQ